MVLTGCTSNPKVITETKIITEALPTQLDKDCDDTIYIPWTVIENIIQENAALRNELQRCAARMRAVRVWNKSILQKNAPNVN